MTPSATPIVDSVGNITTNDSAVNKVPIANLLTDDGSLPAFASLSHIHANAVAITTMQKALMNWYALAARWTPRYSR